MIYHFQGQCFLYFKEFCNYLFSTKVILPKDLQIVTCSNNEKDSILLKQLRANDIKYINTVPQNCKWDNTIKIKYILEALKKITAKYVLILDANDVLIDGDLSDIINKFKKEDKKLFYNATCNNYPNIEIDKIPNRETRGKFKYFNAGCCIGFTKYAIEFYEYAQQYMNLDNPWKSEQFIIRNAFKDKMADIDFDFQSKIFQTVSGCIVINNNDIWKVI